MAIPSIAQAARGDFALIVTPFEFRSSTVWTPDPALIGKMATSYVWGSAASGGAARRTGSSDPGFATGGSTGGLAIKRFRLRGIPYDLIIGAGGLGVAAGGLGTFLDGNDGEDSVISDGEDLECIGHGGTKGLAALGLQTAGSEGGGFSGADFGFVGGPSGGVDVSGGGGIATGGGGVPWLMNGHPSGGVTGSSGTTVRLATGGGGLRGASLGRTMANGQSATLGGRGLDALPWLFNGVVGQSGNATHSELTSPSVADFLSSGGCSNTGSSATSGSCSLLGASGAAACNSGTATSGNAGGGLILIYVEL